MIWPSHLTTLVRLKRSYFRLPRCQLCLKTAGQQQFKKDETPEDDDTTEEQWQVD